MGLIDLFTNSTTAGNGLVDRLCRENGSVNFRFGYLARVAGMTPAFFKRICSTMAGEVAHVETGLRGKGLL